MSAASIKDFLKRKNVSITVQTYLIDALEHASAFLLLLDGTISELLDSSSTLKFLM